MVAVLNEHDIKYDSFNILVDKGVREGLKEFGDWPTFPQLWVDGQLVGGLEIVSIPGLPYGLELLLTSSTRFARK
jgi:glutaredoxin-related protein